LFDIFGFIPDAVAGFPLPRARNYDIVLEASLSLPRVRVRSQQSKNQDTHLRCPTSGHRYGHSSAGSAST